MVVGLKHRGRVHRFLTLPGGDPALRHEVSLNHADMYKCLFYLASQAFCSGGRVPLGGTIGHSKVQVRVLHHSQPILKTESGKEEWLGDRFLL